MASQLAANSENSANNIKSADRAKLALSTRGGTGGWVLRFRDDAVVRAGVNGCNSQVGAALHSGERSRAQTCTKSPAGHCVNTARMTACKRRETQFTAQVVQHI